MGQSGISIIEKKEREDFALYVRRQKHNCLYIILNIAWDKKENVILIIL